MLAVLVAGLSLACGCGSSGGTPCRSSADCAASEACVNGACVARSDAAPTDGAPDGPGDGAPDGPGDGAPDGPGDGAPDGPGDGAPDGPGDAAPTDGAPDGPGDGAPDGPGDGAPDGPGDGGSGCDPGLTYCAFDCVDLETDEYHCGACGVECHWDEYCEAGACTMEAVHTSQADFLAGSINAHGRDLYVSPEGSVRRVHSGDLNNDGELDLVFTNFYDAGPPASYANPSYIYWGPGGRGYSAAARASLDTVGALAAVAADFDRDGEVDLAICQHHDGAGYNVNSLVLWSADDLDRTLLPTQGCYGVATGDLDRDGWLDLVFANHYDGATLTLDSYIYWGSASGFSVGDRQGLPTVGAAEIEIADLDADGWLDLLFVSYKDAGTYLVDSYIYWGGASGYSAGDRTVLPGEGVIASVVADLDADGWLDVVFANFYDGATYQNDSFVYWGSSSGFSTGDRSLLPGLGARSLSAADLNADGDLDLVMGNYYNDTTTGCDSYVYWGSTTGFSTGSRALIPTVGVLGSVVADYDGDTYLDVLFLHYRDDVPVTVRDSRLHWGTASGPTGTTYVDLPGIGAFKSFATDFGNAYDRGTREYFVSDAIDSGAASTYGLLEWDAITPPGTTITFQIRTAATEAGLSAAPWQGPAGAGDEYTVSGTDVRASHDGGRWIQYRAIFDSGNFARGPRLDEVRLRWER